jgi:hypothetical protein
MPSTRGFFSFRGSIARTPSSRRTASAEQDLQQRSPLHPQAQCWLRWGPNWRGQVQNGKSQFHQTIAWASHRRRWTKGESIASTALNCMGPGDGGETGETLSTNPR